MDESSFHYPESRFMAMYLIVFLLISAHGASAVCNNDDKAALLKFKLSITNDSLGALTSWSNTSRDCCRGWTGVRCDTPNRRVFKIDLSNQELHGEINPSLGSLSALDQLDLSNNHLTGSIPSSLTKLISLKRLDLAYNYGLTGTIPGDIGNMKSLVRIRLQSNKLTGGIPESFGKLNNLVYCELDDNMLQGPVPDSFTAQTSSLAFLELSKNKLTSLPKNLSSLTDLGILYMGSNPLSFQSIAGITTLPSLGELHLSNAGLKGPVPKSFITGLKLRQSDDFVTTLLDLSGNSISGGIPPELGNITTLESLQLQQNKFTGQIPKELLQIDDLRWFNVSYNMLKGQIPQSSPFTSFDPSAYAGNPGLCGTPLPACKP